MLKSQSRPRRTRSTSSNEQSSQNGNQRRTRSSPHDVNLDDHEINRISRLTRRRKIINSNLRKDNRKLLESRQGPQHDISAPLPTPPSVSDDASVTSSSDSEVEPSKAGIEISTEVSPVPQKGIDTLATKLKDVEEQKKKLTESMTQFNELKEQVQLLQQIVTSSFSQISSQTQPKEPEQQRLTQADKDEEIQTLRSRVSFLEGQLSFQRKTITSSPASTQVDDTIFTHPSNLSTPLRPIMSHTSGTDPPTSAFSFTTPINSQQNNSTPTDLLSTPMLGNTRINSSILEQMVQVMKQHELFHSMRSQTVSFSSSPLPKTPVEPVMINSSPLRPIEQEHSEVEMSDVPFSSPLKRSHDEGIFTVDDEISHTDDTLHDSVDEGEEWSDLGSTGLSSPLKRHKIDDSRIEHGLEIEEEEGQQEDQQEEQQEEQEELEKQEVQAVQDDQEVEQEEEDDQEPEKEEEQEEQEEGVVDEENHESTAEITPVEPAEPSMEMTETQLDEPEKQQEPLITQSTAQQSQTNNISSLPFPLTFQSVPICLIVLHLHLTGKLKLPFTQLLRSPITHVLYPDPTLLCQYCITPIITIQVNKQTGETNVKVIDHDHAYNGKCSKSIKDITHTTKMAMLNSRARSLPRLNLLNKWYEQKVSQGDASLGLRGFRLGLIVLGIREFEGLEFMIFCTLRNVLYENKSCISRGEVLKYQGLKSLGKCSDLIFDLICQSWCEDFDNEKLIKELELFCCSPSADATIGIRPFNVDSWKNKVRASIKRRLNKHHKDEIIEVMNLEKAQST
ncbi:hypothetical protein WICPIJ_003889 [Wickerhamomyces pijperi]|uniref:Uncharacterized protein n=1 Tax=Wickerhamomyces pijperi TaxID=599730 RepID=A0A9P8Q8R9_WICPI|nr:hypothetical protein WICPIJ_003889 [Wickerhamomyces pijperi]